jgi:hydroxymethylglutaryl-CoA reductase (NADPH)
MRNVAEGALVASTNRGARAINASGGCQSFVYSDGMSRAPVVAMPTVREAVQLKKWIECPERLGMLKQDKTSQFGAHLGPLPHKPDVD